MNGHRTTARELWLATRAIGTAEHSGPRVASSVQRTAGPANLWDLLITLGCGCRTREFAARVHVKITRTIRRAVNCEHVMTSSVRGASLQRLLQMGVSG